MLGFYKAFVMNMGECKYVVNNLFILIEPKPYLNN